MAEQLPGGYAGKILRADLSKNTTSVEELDEKLCRKYLGGAGFIAHYLYKELKPGVDPLGPDNKLIFALGPMTGVMLAGNDRSCIGAKSPLSNGIIKSESGGWWAAELKHAGFDGIIVDGKADKPVYLWVHDGEAEIKDASHLWGKETKETEIIIREELGDSKIRVSMIGPGGENMVKFACIMNGCYDAHGRGGSGAVMGSKNLKAIAVRGTGMPKVASPDGVKALRDWLTTNKNLWSRMAENGTGGTGAAIEMQVTSGNVPVNNFRDGILPNAKETDCLEVKIHMDGCWACPIRCKKVVENKGKYEVDAAYGGPEYETIGAVGASCGVTDIKAISLANQICNANSLDTISAGMAVSFAMECFENGLLTTEDTGGVELKFGNTDSMLKTLELIANREGIGDLLAEGTKIAAQRIGKGADKFSMEVKGVAIPMHEPRLKHILGVGYMVNPHGADHCCNLHDAMIASEGRGLENLKPIMGDLGPRPIEDYGPLKTAMMRNVRFDRIIRDSLIACQFVSFNHSHLAEITRAVTGWDTGTAELFRIAERILTTFQLINLREGLSVEDDQLPQRFFEGKSGALADKPCDPDELIAARNYYYTLMGWDSKTGVPLKEKVEELDIA
ncbi:aldehyde ferredoxin oxidoreductase family protein [Chloroflexota bacterium]